MSPPAGTSRRSLARFSSSVASSPAKRAERMPGAPPSAAASMPESSATAGEPVAAAAARALTSAFSAKVLPSSGGSSTSGGSASSSWGASSRPELAHLVRVAGCQHQAHRRRQAVWGATAARCDSRSVAMPSAARPSSSSSEARESGVRSPVACTSTRPSSPVITTFMSTSALESSG